MLIQMFSLLCIYIKAKSEPNSASDWPPSCFCAISRDVLLFWEPKTPKNSPKPPLFLPEVPPPGSSTQTGSTAAHAHRTLHYSHLYIKLKLNMDKNNF